jgi:hypothetical protein
VSVVVVPDEDQTPPETGVFGRHDWAKALMDAVATAMTAKTRIKVRSAVVCKRFVVITRHAYCETSIADTLVE